MSEVTFHISDIRSLVPLPDWRGVARATGVSVFSNFQGRTPDSWNSALSACVLAANDKRPMLVYASQSIAFSRHDGVVIAYDGFDWHCRSEYEVRFGRRLPYFDLERHCTHDLSLDDTES